MFIYVYIYFTFFIVDIFSSNKLLNKIVTKFYYFANCKNALKRYEACNFIKKETLAQVFYCKSCEIFKNTFFTEHLRTNASGSINITHTRNKSFTYLAVTRLKFHPYIFILDLKRFNKSEF